MKYTRTDYLNNGEDWRTEYFEGTVEEIIRLLYNGENEDLLESLGVQTHDSSGNVLPLRDIFKQLEDIVDNTCEVCGSGYEVTKISLMSDEQEVETKRLCSVCLGMFFNEEIKVCDCCKRKAEDLFVSPKKNGEKWCEICIDAWLFQYNVQCDVCGSWVEGNRVEYDKNRYICESCNIKCDLCGKPLLGNVEMHFSKESPPTKLCDDCAVATWPIFEWEEE